MGEDDPNRSLKWPTHSINRLFGRELTKRACTVQRQMLVSGAIEADAIQGKSGGKGSKGNGQVSKAEAKVSMIAPRGISDQGGKKGMFFLLWRQGR